MGSARSLTPEENARVLAAVETLLKTRSQVEVATMIGVAQPTVSAMKNKRHQFGYASARRVAEAVGVHVDDLLGVAPSGIQARGPVPSTALGAREDWPDIRAEAERRYGTRLDADVMLDVAHMSFGRMPEVVTAEDVKRWHDMLVEIYARDPKAREAARAR